MLHRYVGEGEHQSIAKRKWTRLFALSIICAFFIVAFIASDSVAYELGQQPKYQAQAQSPTNQKQVQQEGLSAQDRSLFAYSKSTIEELVSQLSTHPEHPFTTQLASLQEKIDYLTSLELQLDGLREQYSLAQSQYELAVAKESDAFAEYNKARESVAEAQQKYNIALDQYNDPNNYIDDPTWERPIIEQIIERQVPYTVLVPYTTETTYQGNLTASVYNYLGYNNAPPFPYEIDAQPFYSTSVPNIDYNWGGGQVLNSGLYEDVLVKFEGNIVIPTTDNYTFYMSADDGNTLTIDEQQLIYGWWDKGGGGPTSESTTLDAGIHSLTSYFYENGGGAAVTLYYLTESTPYWQVVPADWFGQYTVTETIYVEETRYETVYETVYVPDPNAVAPTIPNPELYKLYKLAQSELSNQTTLLDNATELLDDAEGQTKQLHKDVTSLEADISTLEITLAQNEAEYEATLQTLQADITTYITQPEPFIDLTAVPLIGDALSALSDVGETLANIGSDMSQKTREKAEKVVISAIIVTQVAQIATATAVASASSGSTGRRK